VEGRGREGRREKGREDHDRRLNAPSRASQVHSRENSRDTIKLTTATAFSGKREYQVTIWLFVQFRLYTHVFIPIFVRR
jgi:hypothetical protein